MARMIEIEGVGEVYAQKLEAAGIHEISAFLEMGASREGRRKLAELTGIDATLILEWLNHADLMRIKGIGGEYSDLLEEAGVDTVAELACRNAENLFQALTQINAEKKLVRQLPSQGQVADWIEQAKNLPRVLEY